MFRVGFNIKPIKKNKKHPKNGALKKDALLPSEQWQVL
jgi:hypothetical protein